MTKEARSTKSNSKSKTSKPQSLKVLIVEDSEDDALLLIRELKKGGYNPVYERVETAAAMKKALQEKQWDIILCDHKLPKFNAPSAIAVLKETNIDIPLIIVSGAISEETAAEGMRLGAHDYIMKNNLSRLCPVIARELQEAETSNKQKQAEETILHSEKRFKALYQESPIPTFTWQKKGDNFFLVDFNSAAILFTKGKAVTYRGKSAQELYRERPEIIDDMLRCFKEQSTISKELVSQHFVPRRLLSVYYSYIPPDLIIVHMEDITERKRAEEALRESEERYRRIVDNSLMGIGISCGNQVIFANPALLRLFGYNDLDEFIKIPLLNHVASASHEFIAARMEKIAQGKPVPDEFEYDIIRKDGLTRTLLASSQRFTLEGKAYAQTIFQDITERKRAEEALAKSEEKFRKAFYTSPDSVNINRLEDGMYISINPGFSKIMGYTEADIIGKTSAEYNIWANIEDRRKLVAGLKKGGEVINLEAAFRTKTGEIRYGLMSASLIDLNGVPHILNITRDITDRKQAEEALRLSEEKYRLVVENAREAIIITQDVKILFVNRVAIDMIGYSNDISTSKPFTDFIHPDDRDMVVDNHIRRIKGEEVPPVYSFRVISQDGTVIWVELNATLIQWKERPATLNFLNNITERKKAEEELRKSEENFRRSLDDSPLGIRIVTAEGETIYANRAILDIYGYDSVEELKKVPLRQRYTPESYADFQIRNEKRRQGKFSPSEYAIRILRKNGEIRHVQVFRKEVIWNGVKQFQVIYHDITEQKRIEEELKKSEEKYWLTFSSTSDVIFTVDSELKVSNITPSVEKILGYKPEELLNQPFKNLNLMTPESRERAIANVMRVLSGEDVPITVYEFITKDGIRGIGEITGSPIIQENKIIGVTCVARDVTERKRAEEEREKLQAQLLQSQKMESVGRLAGGVAHDFNNILTTILGRTALAMKRCKPTGPIHAHLKAIEKSTLRSADLIRQLLAFARKQTVAPKVLDLNDTVANMLKIIQPLIGEDINFAWIPGANVWPVKIDPTQIDQLLANLCVNARDAISGVGRIAIETENAVFDDAYCTVHHGFNPGEYATLAVSDDGCGMDKDVLDHIFEPFFTTKEVGRGTGLGLATVYGIAKQNEGFINVYSEPGKGSTFKIYLPRFVGEAMEPTVESTAETPKGRGETVLLVEDDVEIRDVSQIMLEQLGYKVLTASTPGEALRQAKDKTAEIELLITDVVMPEMNGRDLAKLLGEIRPGLKCLFASGYTANIIAHQGILDEGVHFLKKPFSIKDLAIKVRQALEQE